MKLLLKISYLGTHYAGYQVQPNADTVQKQLNLASERLFGFPCDIVGCSRTDSGVHANMFCATVSKKGFSSLETDIPTARIPLAFTANLPDDICVYDATFVPDDFHARYDVAMKEYIYRIWNYPIRNPFELDRTYQLPKILSDDDIIRMQKSASYFIGRHDYSAFMAQGSKITDTVRTVFESEISKNGHNIVFRVRADGFLYNMVRILAGTLVEVGEGKIAPDDISKIIESHDRSRAGRTLPACGLYLNRVFYTNDPFGKE